MNERNWFPLNLLIDRQKEKSSYRKEVCCNGNTRNHTGSQSRLYVFQPTKGGRVQTSRQGRFDKIVG